MIPAPAAPTTTMTMNTAAAATAAALTAATNAYEESIKNPLGTVHYFF